MSVDMNKFGVLDAKDVYEYVLINKNGMKVCVLNLGAIIKNIYVHDKNGKLQDVVLGHNTCEDYKTNEGYLGAAIGRCANRLEKGTFEIAGKSVTALSKGDLSKQKEYNSFKAHKRCYSKKEECILWKKLLTF